MLREIRTGIGIIALGILLGLPLAAWGQTRSDTGRHKPAPAEEAPKDEDRAGESSPVAAGPRWYFGGSAGLQGGGDLFRVATLDGGGVPWDPESGGGFNASRFTATMDRDLSLGFYLGYDLGPTWSLRADLGWSQMDVGAEALVGQVGAVFLFDRFDVLNLGLGVEARLTRHSSYPYANFSLLASHLGPGVVKELEQTNLGGRLGMGYLQVLDSVWSLRFEGRMAVTGFSVGDYVPQTLLSDQPPLEYEPESRIIYFEFLIGVQGRI